MLCPVRELRRSGFQCFCQLVKVLLHLTVVLNHIVSGQRLNTPHAGSHACLGYDFKQGDLAGVGHMGSAAKLLGELAHGNHPDLLAVFLTEQRHGAGFFCFLNSHHLGNHRKRRLDLLVYQSLHLLDFLCRHGLEMGEVKAQAGGGYQRTFLLHVGAQNGLQSLLQQMGGTVVLAGVRAACRIHLKGHLVIYGNHAGFHHAHMAVFSAPQMDGILHTEQAVFGADHAGIAFLSAHGGIEGSLLHENGSPLSFHQSIHQLIFCGKHRYLGSILQSVVTGKFGGDRHVNLIVDRGVRTHVVGHLTALSGAGPLYLHLLFEAFFIDGIALLLQNLLGQIHGESIGIIQFESILAVQHALAGSFHLLLHVGEDLQALVDGLVELAFLIVQYIDNEILFLFQLRITVPGAFDYSQRQVRQEFALNTQQAAMTGSPADQTAQHVAPSLVGGHNAVGNQEGGRTDMVRDQTDGNVRFVVCSVGFSRDLADPVSQGADGIHVENGIHVLYHHGQTLQAHAGVDIFLFQGGVVALPVVFKLGKYVVPHFHVPVAVAAHGASRFAAAVFFSPVIVDLGTGTAGACPVFPEVVLLVETENPLRRDAYLFIPDIKGLVVLQIHGRIQAVRIQSHHLGQKLPGPGDGLFLKIIPEGKVAQHLKEGAVAGCFSHVLNITCPDTFLTGGHTGSGRDLRSGKIRFQRSHSRIDQQKTFVILGNQGKTLHHQMTLALKKIQKHLTKLIYSILFHCSILLRYITAADGSAVFAADHPGGRTAAADQLPAASHSIYFITHDAF